MRIHLTIAAAVAIAAASLAPAFAAPPEILGLQGLNNSGETGTITLVAKGSTTLVTLRVEGGPRGVAQPAHIHKGTCEKLNPAPAYPLKSLVNGRSTTLVKAPLSKLMSGHYAVNVHQSSKNLKHYVACGELVR